MPTSPGSRSSSPCRPSRVQWALRILAAIGLPAAFLALTEGSLRVLDIGEPAAFTVPCTSAGVPSYCDNPHFTWRFFPPAIARAPSPFAFPRDKAPDTYRIFVLGSSAAQGDPEPSFGFSRQLALLLEDRYPGARFEVVNAAVTAINSHVVLPIARDLARREADLFLVYVGNNEVVGPFGAGTVFSPLSSSLDLIRAGIAVRGTRIGQLFARASAGEAPSRWRGMGMFLDRTVREDDPRLAIVYRHFEANLREIVATAGAAGAQAILVTVGSNLKDSAPFASLHGAALDSRALERWETEFRSGVEHEAAGRIEQALEAYRRAEALDDDHAELQFRMAHLLRAAGEKSGVRERLVRARDLDALRFRADSRINDVIRDMARSERVPLLDAERLFERVSPDGLPGDELFLEHVHLDFHGNYVLAEALLDEIGALLPGRIATLASGLPALDESAVRERLAYTAFDRARVLSTVLSRMSRAPFTLQCRNTAEQLRSSRDGLRSAEQRRQSLLEYETALERRPTDPWLHANHARLLHRLDMLPEAEAEYRAHLGRLPQAPYVRERLAGALAEQERYEEAVAECRLALALAPGLTDAYETLGRSLAALERWDESTAAYEQLYALDPSASRRIMREVARNRLRKK